MSQSSTPPG
ncbi:Protein of unknown function, partial [Gryllus bimaculatus]